MSKFKKQVLKSIYFQYQFRYFTCKRFIFFNGKRATWQYTWLNCKYAAQNKLFEYKCGLKLKQPMFDVPNKKKTDYYHQLLLIILIIIQNDLNYYYDTKIFNTILLYTNGKWKFELFF